MIEFTVPGEPVPQPRPRVTARGKFAHAYVPKKHPVHAYRHSLQLAAIDAGLRKTSDPIVVEIVATFARPKSHVGKSGVKKTAPLLPRADVDNIAKAVLDAIGPIVGNDSQVQKAIVEKNYGVSGFTTVRVA